LVVITLLIFFFGLSESADKLQSLTKLFHKNNLIDFSLSDLGKYIEKGPRDYHIFIFFTSETQAFPCATCSVMKPEIELALKWYKNYIKKTGQEPKIFFGIIELAKRKDVFEKYQQKIRQLPLFAYFGPNNANNIKFDINLDHDVFNVQVEEINAIGISEFVMSKSKIKYDMDRPLDYNLLLLVGLGIIMVAVIVYRLPKVLQSAKEPRLWFVLILLVMFFSYSGMVFNFNNRPPFMHVDQNKVVHWFYPSLRHQFVLEGFIMGALTLTGSIFFVLLGILVPKVQSSRNRRLLFWFVFIISMGILVAVRQTFEIKLR